MDSETLKGEIYINKSLRLKASIVKEIEELAVIENRTFTNMFETLLMKCINNEELLEKRRPKWLLEDGDFESCDWLPDFLPEVGVVSEDWAKGSIEIDRFEDYPITDCLKCGTIDDHYEIENNTRWKCKKCGHKFSATSGTFIDSTNIGYAYWFRLAWLLADLRFPINSVLIARDLCLTQKSVYYMLTSIKESMSLEGKGIKYKIPQDANGYNIMEALVKLKEKVLSQEILVHKKPTTITKGKVKTQSKKPPAIDNIPSVDIISFGEDEKIEATRKVCVKCKEPKSIQLFNIGSDKCKSCDGTFNKERLEKWEMV